MDPKNCPQCKKRGYVLETRRREDSVYRLYECHRDQTRWTTHEHMTKVLFAPKGAV